MDYMVISLVLFVVLIVIMFASVRIEYVGQGDNKLAHIPVDMLNERNPSGVRAGYNPSTSINKSSTMVADNIGKVNPDAPKYGLFNLPEKDEYMSPTFREQIDNMRTRFYYDNCQFSLLPPSGSSGNSGNNINTTK